MKLDSDTISDAAQRIGIKPDELAAVIQRGTAVSYQAGDYLFHESTPRQWLGIVTEGEMKAGRRVGTWTQTDRSGAVRKTAYKTP